MTYRAAVPVVFFVLTACGALGAALAAANPAPLPPDPPPPKPPAVVFAPRFADPVPKIEPKPLPKGPNKLLVHRNGNFTLLDPDGKNDKQVSKDRALYHPSGGAALSPDGKRLAVLIPDPLPPDDGTPGARKRTATLHVRGLDEKEPGTSLGVQRQTLAWSPDGTEGVCCDFIDGPDKKSPEAAHHVVNVKTREKAALKLPADHLLTDWSRDGKFFLTMRVVGGVEKPRSRLCLMNRDGTEHKALTGEDQLALFGRIAPDGIGGIVSPLPRRRQR